VCTASERATWSALASPRGRKWAPIGACGDQDRRVLQTDRAAFRDGRGHSRALLYADPSQRWLFLCSKSVQVSVSTLRYYDQVGLLKPVEVDHLTGYRSYSASQLPRLHRIPALKGLGFSLEPIAAVLAAGVTPEQMRGMLRPRHAPISQQRVAVQIQPTDAEMRLEQIEREKQISSYDVILKHVDTQLVALIRANVGKHWCSGTTPSSKNGTLMVPLRFGYATVFQRADGCTSTSGWQLISR
jgi:DNA-binding transcriptional MerR regulator